MHIAFKEPSRACRPDSDCSPWPLVPETNSQTPPGKKDKIKKKEKEKEKEDLDPLFHGQP
jgi:hypothetical protein